jgi:hypothetical protein
MWVEAWTDPWDAALTFVLFSVISLPAPPQILDKRMAAAEGFSAQVLSSLDSQVAEVEDMLSYVADILNTGTHTQHPISLSGTKQHTD